MKINTQVGVKFDVVLLFTILITVYIRLLHRIHFPQTCIRGTLTLENNALPLKGVRASELGSLCHVGKTMLTLIIIITGRVPVLTTITKNCEA